MLCWSAWPVERLMQICLNSIGGVAATGRQVAVSICMAWTQQSICWSSVCVCLCVRALNKALTEGTKESLPK